MALLVSAAWFDCQESCNFPFGSTQWYLNGQLLDHLDTKSRFVVSINERGLAITKLKLKDAGEYACKVSSDRITYERHGNLDVIDQSNQFSAISQCCKRHLNFTFVNSQKIIIKNLSDLHSSNTIS